MRRVLQDTVDKAYNDAVYIRSKEGVIQILTPTPSVQRGTWAWLPIYPVSLMDEGASVTCYSFREALATGVKNGDVTQHGSYAEAYAYAGTLLRG